MDSAPLDVFMLSAWIRFADENANLRVHHPTDITDVHVLPDGRYRGLFNWRGAEYVTHYALVQGYALVVSFMVPVGGPEKVVYINLAEADIPPHAVEELITQTREHKTSELKVQAFVSMAGAGRSDASTITLDTAVVGRATVVRSMTLDMPAEDARYIVATINKYKAQVRLM